MNRLVVHLYQYPNKLNCYTIASHDLPVLVLQLILSPVLKKAIKWTRRFNFLEIVFYKNIYGPEFLVTMLIYIDVVKPRLSRSDTDNRSRVAQELEDFLSIFFTFQNSNSIWPTSHAPIYELPGSFLVRHVPAHCLSNPQLEFVRRNFIGDIFGFFPSASHF